jgi:hypothetical protein
MKTIAALFALAALAACGQSQTDKAATASAAPHSNAVPGTFVRTNADGSLVTEFLKSDGTYTLRVGGELTESGKWAGKDNKTCFTPDKGKETCSTDSPVGADGTFTETPDGGTPYKVEKTA